MLRSKATSDTANEALQLEAAMERAPDLSAFYEGGEEDIENASSDQSQRTSLMEGDHEDANEAARELKETVIKKEERNVKKSRVLVGLTMSFCAIAVTAAVYVLARRSDQNSFELEVSEFVV